MNSPLQVSRQFDTVIDFGTLEHVFNLPIAFANVAALCKRGGRIIHALPANNYSGHGFYQFSPELFFSIYSAKNGFADIEVFIAEVTDHVNWWKSAVPAGGVRVEFTSRRRSYVLAISRKVEDETRQSVQQSDYVAIWAGGEADPTPRRPSVRQSAHNVLKQTPFLWRLATSLLTPVNTHESADYHVLSDANPGFRRIRIDDLIGSPASSIGGSE